jgi:hypothetical protein
MLNNLKRYHVYTDYRGPVGSYEDPHGDYVKWEDVQEILAKDEPEVLLHIQATYPDGRTRQFSIVVNIGPITNDSLNMYSENLKQLLAIYGDLVDKVEILSFSKLDS